jgi:hypothetical protein
VSGRNEAIGDAVEATAALLLASAARDELTVSGDLRVNEKDAAHLLGYSAANLKALRQEGNGPVSYALGMNGGRISYRLRDLAAWIEMAREDFHR